MRSIDESDQSQLDAGYNFLKHKMKLDFNATEETSKENDRQKRAQQILAVKYGKIKEEMRDSVPDIMNNLQQMVRCDLVASHISGRMLRIAHSPV